MGPLIETINRKGVVLQALNLNNLTDLNISEKE